MMKATDVLKFDDPPPLRQMDQSAFRCVLLQRKMRPRSMIIIRVASEYVLQMALPQDDHVIHIPCGSNR